MYGDAEVLVEDEDELDIKEPLLKPPETNVYDLTIQDPENIPEATFNKTFLFGMTKMPQLIRNVCLVGPLHSGKTSIMDMFIKSTHLTKQPVCINIHFFFNF